MGHSTNVTVVGCGVAGLTSGIRLLEAGYDVEIIAREDLRRTSDVAAAFWYPFRAEPRERLIPWADRAYREFRLLAEDESTGVNALPIRHYYTAASAPEAWWTGSVEGFSSLDPDQLPAGYQSGFTYTTYLSDTSKYMPYLRERFDDLGGRVTLHEISTLEELLDADRLVVNCTGVWAGTVANDPLVLPIRGQILRVRRPEWMPMQVLDGDGVALICRSGDCIIGGANEDGSWEREARPADRQTLLDRVARLCPELVNPEILEDKVGLRPGRPEVRVELEKRSGATVIHNYGHGGAGFTLSWGCAEEVVKLASDASK